MKIKKIINGRQKPPETVKRGIIILDNNPLSIASFFEEYGEVI